MSNIVLGPARLTQAQEGDAARPRKGRPVNGRKFSGSDGTGPAEQIECRRCRHWRPFVTQWGHCGCEMVRCHVDGEAPLVTRGSFSCRFFSPASAAVRKARAVQPQEPLQPPVLAAAE